MKVVVAGDLHGDLKALQRILALEPTADLYLLTGDSQLDESVLFPFVSVKGNCDFDSRLPDSRLISTPFGNLLITHGHQRYRYPLSSLQAQKVRIFITGHTHIKKHTIVDGIEFFNPGSASSPRDGGRGSYLVLKLGAAEILSEFKTL